MSSVFFLAAGLCISCQKDSLVEQAASVKGVTVTATIADADTKVSFVEDATNKKLKASWENGDRIVGWDAAGNAIELEIAEINKNTAIFKAVTGSAAIPTSGKVYMIYAPGKSYSDISNKSLEYDLSSQSLDKVPALMTATGEVKDNVLALTFRNELAIVAVKNPTFPVTTSTTFSGLKISGDNINTVAKFGSDDSGVTVTPSTPGAITRSCSIETDLSGNATANVLFAVLPNSTAADVTVSTVNPEGYLISFTGKSFAAGQCYLLEEKKLSKKTFTITIADGITNGSVTTSPAGSCEKGQTVTVIPDAEEDYVVDKVTYNDGTEHDITSTRSFTMPEKDVTVNITYRYALLSGTFTVAADGGNGQPKKVRFTNGNLKWTNNEWNIESSQENYSKEGYFYWSKDLEVAIKRPYADPNTDIADKLFCHEDTPITVFGTSGLFNLSGPEWEYLLKTRNEVNRFAYANVNGKTGMLIFPDSYSDTEVSGTGIGTVNKDDYPAFPTDPMETDTWEQMQSAGVVFLPQTYYLQKSGSQNSYSGLRGLYWTSTTSTYDVTKSYALIINNAQVNIRAFNGCERENGYPIRLVKNIPQAVN